MIDFLIFYEVGVREFESIALLGHELIKRGYSVDYFGFEDADHNKYIKNRKRISKYYNNVDTAIMPSLYHDKEIYNTVYYVCGHCKHIVNLRWEQYFGNGPMQDMNSALFPQEDAKKAYHLCWGAKSYESLLIRGNEKNFLPITGAIQLDFLRPEFSDFYMGRKELFKKYNLDVGKKTVLYISSFATATRTERLKEAVKKDFAGKYDFKDDTFSFHKESYEITIEWIETFLKKYPNVQFIYRPHPAENETEKIYRLEQYENFRNVSDYSVKQWIVCCDIVTTWVSTSIVEAYFAGKYCYIIRPLPYPQDIDICVYNGAKYINTLDDFLKISKANEEPSIEERKIREYYSVQDNRASYIRTADFLEIIIKQGVAFEWDSDKAHVFDKKRRMLFMRNIIFNIYSIGLTFFMKIYRKTGIKFPRIVQVRIDNLQTAIEKKKNRRSSLKEELNITIDRINRYFDMRL